MKNTIKVLGFRPLVCRPLVCTALVAAIVFSMTAATCGGSKAASSNVSSGDDLSTPPATPAAQTASIGAMKWTAVADSTFGSRDTIYGIAYGNNRLVAVGFNGMMAYSDD